MLQCKPCDAAKNGRDMPHGARQNVGRYPGRAEETRRPGSSFFFGYSSWGPVGPHGKNVIEGRVTMSQEISIADLLPGGRYAELPSAQGPEPRSSARGS